MRRTLPILLLVVLGLGCSSGTQPGEVNTQAIDAARAAAEPQAPLFRGHLRRDGGSLRFQVCTGDAEMPAVDNTSGVLDQTLGGFGDDATDDGWYVEFKGKKVSGAQAGDDGDAMRIDELYYCAALPETLGCSEELAGAQFAAVGNEPNWSLVVTEQGIVFDQMGSTRYAFPYQKPQKASYGWLIKTTRNQPPNDDVVIQIEKNPCRNTMSGAWSCWSASVVLDNQSYVGCARPGW